MRSRTIGHSTALLCFSYLVPLQLLLAQGANQPKPTEPILRIDAGGPTSYVSSLAMTQDGSTFMSAGLDKIVRVWRLENNRFRNDPKSTLRVPIGPGVDGAINAIALSEDDRWLAVAGVGMVKGVAGFREGGGMLPIEAMTDEMRLDEGQILLFDRKSGDTYRLRGHHGRIISLSISGNRLASLGADWDRSSAKAVSTLRLWNLDEQKQLQEQTLADLTSLDSVQIILLNSPSPVVCVAGNDGKMRTWDCAAQRVLPSEVGEFNSAIHRLAKGDVLVAGRAGKTQDAKLQHWSIEAGQAPKLRDEVPITSTNASELVLPRAIERLSQDNVAIATLIMRRQGTDWSPAEMRLQIVNTQVKKVVSTLSLWPIKGNLTSVPRLVSTPASKQLVVAGNPDFSLRVFDKAELLQGRNVATTLNSNASMFEAVAFAHQADQTGLLLRDPTLPGADHNLVFNLSKQRLTAHTAQDGWVKDALPHGLTLQSDGKVIRASRGGAIVGSITLPANETLTNAAPGLATALGSRAPIVAIATHRDGNPRLQIYDVTSGLPIREFTGHTERIVDLAFSGDFRLLASVSPDRTVSVWSLTDLGDIVGQHGQLRGVRVDDQRRITKIDVGSPHSNQLAIGDELQGTVEGGQLKSWESTAKFYKSWWQAQPNQKVVLRRLRQNAAQDITVTVDQGIDERKPLFSILITNQQNVADRQWVGWSPLGPFESSDPRIEQLLGWHFNSDQLGQPTYYAQLNQYREEYYRDALLADLTAAGQLKPAKPKPLARPTISLFPASSTNPDVEVDESNRLRLPVDTLQVVVDSSIAPRQVASIELQIDGAAAGNLSLDYDATWIGPLPATVNTRGLHSVVATLITKENPPQRFAQELSFNFTPAPPQLVLPPEIATVSVTREASTRIRALVTPSVGPAKVALQRLVDGQWQEVKAWEAEKEQRIDETVELEVGENELRLIAANRDQPLATAQPQATEDPRSAGNNELAVKQLRITRAEVFPPTIQLNNFTFNQSGMVQSQPLLAGQSTVVDVPNVELTGIVRAFDTQLSKVTVEVNGVLGAAVGKQPQETFELKQPIQFKPGENQIVVRAAAANQKSTESRVTVVYRPRIPAIAMMTPTDINQQLTAPYPFTAEFSQSPSQQPFKVQLLVNEAEVPDVKIANGRIAANLILRPGDNKVSLRATNQWAATPVENTTYISYRPTPTISSVVIPETIAEPNFSATIQGTTAAPIRSLTFDGITLPASQFKLTEQKNQYTISLSNLKRIGSQPLAELQIVAEGGGVATKQIRLPKIEARVAAKPPAVEILAPQRDSIARLAAVDLSFLIESESDVQGIRVVHNQQIVELPPPLQMKAGQHEKQVPLQLEPGLNSIEVIVSNAGGLQRQTLNVSLMEEPVTLQIARVLPKEFSNEPIVVSVDAQNRAKANEAASQGKVWVEGSVKWNETLDQRFGKRDITVQAWVNGYQQLQSRLEMPAPNERQRRFKIPVVLNESTANQVELVLPDLETEIASRTSLTIDCKEPVTEQQLYLLVVGAGQGSDQAMMDATMKALNAERLGKNTFKSNVFSFGKVYGPVQGKYLQRTTVRSRLNAITADARTALVNKPANVVVAIYYQGGEVATADQNFLTLRAPEDPLLSQQDRFDSQEIYQFSRKTCGAHVLLLDVKRLIADDGIASSQPPIEPTGARLSYIRVRNSDDISKSLSAAIQSAPKGDLKSITSALQSLAKNSTELSFEDEVPLAMQELSLK